MSISAALLPEFDHETQVTRTCLERIPGDKLGWKPHEKSMSLGKLGSHLASVLSWMPMTIEQSEFDVAPPGGEPFSPPQYTSVEEMLGAFDQGVAAARAALEKASDETLMAQWSLKKGGVTLFSMPRVACLRSFIFNHSVHHRGQLSVYLRLNDVPVPQIYGPSADEGQM